MEQRPTSEIAYIMKGYPRLSETFITNEIYLLEQMGLGIHIFAIQSLSEPKIPSLAKKIHAKVTYLPEDASVADSQFRRWFQVNFPQLVGGHVKLCQLRPLSYLQTLCSALRFSLKYRTRLFPTFKKVFLKDFLRAGYIAQRVLESGRIGHLHAHFCHGSTTIAMFVSQLTGIPFSFTAHAKDIYLPKLNPGDLLQRKIRKAQFVVTCTEANRVHLQNLCPEVSSLYTMYHGLDTMLFVPATQQEDEPTVPTILAVGRFVEKKGFAYLIQACHLLKEKGYHFHCRIVGEVDEQIALIKQLIREWQLAEVVSLQNAVPQEELRQIYQHCTIFALPCQIAKDGDQDGIPNVLVEAMAMGIPVVSTTISGIPELIEHQVEGLLVPQRDAIALAEALAQLLQNPVMRKQLGKAAREKVCRLFDNKKTTIMLKDLFSSRLAMHQRIAE
jgi:glycosyltransferase involved in cell wall biosynthesis